MKVTEDVLHTLTRSQRAIRRRNGLAAMFHPRSVALIGATDRPASLGETVMKNLLEGAKYRNVYPVNPKRKMVRNLACFPDIASVPGVVDLAVICTPADTVPAIVSDCANSGVRSVVVISAGYRERGKEGAALEAEIATELDRSSIALVGPNCLGIMNPLNGLNATFAERIALPGNVAFISQSGALCTAILDWSIQEQVGFSAFVSSGSMLDVGWPDLIRYFGNDPNTKSILLYIESVGDGHEFMAAAQEVSPKKPIIAIKAGRTEAASKAASSHTGALTGNDDVLDAAFRQCGVLRVNRIADLFYMAELLSKQPLPRGPKLTIVTNAGGPGVLATDTLIETGGELTPLGQDSLNRLNEVLPAHWSHANPVDILGDADPARYAKALDIAINDPGSDGLLAILAPQGMTDPTHCADALVPYAHKLDKPLLTCWMGGPVVQRAKDVLNSAAIPTFEFPDTAARAFTYMWEYTKRQRALSHTVSAMPQPSPNAAAPQIIRAVHEQGRTLLTELESKALLQACDIPTLPILLANTADQAVQHAQALGFPAVLKLHSLTITHKSDIGGVKLNLTTADAVRAAFAEIEAAANQIGAQHFAGVTVQPMAKLKHATELILGSSTDSQFGPVVLFGAGGVMTEIFRDRALALPPLNRGLAMDVIDRTKIAKALKGYRGAKPVDIEKLCDVLSRFSEMVLTLPEISEVDINPLLVSGEQIVALDARVVLDRAL